MDWGSIISGAAPVGLALPRSMNFDVAGIQLSVRGHSLTYTFVDLHGFYFPERSSDHSPIVYDGSNK